MSEDVQIKKMKFKLQMISHFPEQIVKLWIFSQRNNQVSLTQCLLNGNDNIKELVNLNLIYFFKKFKSKNYIFTSLWKIVDEIDEETFNYILDNNLYFNIEHCNSVINNPKYIMKLLDKGYKEVIWFIDESVFFELIKNDEYKKIIFEHMQTASFYDDYVGGYQNKKRIDGYNFLQSDKFFIYFVNELCKDGFNVRDLLKKLMIKVPNNYMTKEKVLAVSLNTGTYWLEYNENNYFSNLLKEYFSEEYYEKIYRYSHFGMAIDYDRSEDIKKLIGLGFVPSKSTILAHENEYEVFIENNFFQVLENDNIYNSRVKPTTRALFLANEKGQNIFNINYVYDVLAEIIENKFDDSNEKLDSKNTKLFLKQLYFDENGPKREVYEKAIFNYKLFNVLLRKEEYLKDYIERFNPSKEVQQYIACIRNNLTGLSLNYLLSTKNIEDIGKYFEDKGPKEELYERALFNSDLFKILLRKDKYLKDYIERFNPSKEVQQYIDFYRNNEIAFSLKDILKINNIEDINNYFDDKGLNEESYKLSLINSKLFDRVFGNEKYLKDYIERFNPSKEIQQYIYFTKENGFILKNFIKVSDDINKYFDGELGLSNYAIKNILSDTNIYENLNKNYFKNYYETNFNIPILNNILLKLDNNYHYFSDFIINTLNLPLPIKENDEKKIKQIYCLDIINDDILIEIIKYVYFGPLDKNIISNMIKNNELLLCVKIYFMICNEWDINNFIKFISNYENNKLLCNNLFKENNLTDDEKLKLRLIFINGYKSASGVINQREDLTDFNKSIYNNNKMIIESDNIDDIKKMIFNSLFNIGTNDVEKINNKYDASNGLIKLKDNINNLSLKDNIDEYDVILKFLFTILNSEDIKGLKAMANKINTLIKNGQINELLEFWNEFSKLDNDLMKICGEELNEKSLDFNELLNTPEDNIPKIQGKNSYNIKNIEVSNSFDYDGQTINSGTNVKMIELEGMPFVTFGHVLNAFGTGGKLSDFNHPRVIGKTHLCLSAIDDNYYSLVERNDRGIDYVQLLFDKLPAQNLVIASNSDVYSASNDNDKNIYSKNGFGSYAPIRENISTTHHGENGYNEYVFFRDGIMPSGILVRGINPTKSEIQAAAYLSKVFGKDVPLVKINKEKYPIRTDEEMKQRDEELKDYYNDLYKQRRKNQNIKDIEKLKQLRDYLIGIYSINDTEQSIRSR